MAFVATSRTLENGARNLVMEFVGFDSAPVANTVAENAVVKVNATTLTLTTHLKIRRILYSIVNASVRMQWDATSPVDIAMLAGYGDYLLTYPQIGVMGIQNDGGAGVTGNVTFTTTEVGAAASAGAAGYTITLFMTKGA